GPGRRHVRSAEPADAVTSQARTRLKGSAARAASAKTANRRLRFLLLAFGVVLAGLLLRAFWLQAVRANALGKLAAKQHYETVQVPAGRGTIFDRTGVELALGEDARTIYADPRQVRAPRTAAIALAKILRLDSSALYMLLTNPRRSFVYIARQADPREARA